MNKGKQNYKCDNCGKDLKEGFSVKGYADVYFNEETQRYEFSVVGKCFEPICDECGEEIDAEAYLVR